MKDEKLSEVLSRLYKCRDLEITNLWQRSIFLSVFLILCFTGYGILVIEMIDCQNISSWFTLNSLCIILAFIGSIISVIWIYMAKGSKAWYEVYEAAISKFENDYYEEIGIPENNVMGEMGVPIDKLNNKLLSMKAGAYSPSKINILLGQICFLGWILIGVIHSAMIYFSWLDIKLNFLEPPLVYVIPILLAILLFLIRWRFQTKSARSEHLYNTIFNKNGLTICSRKEWEGFSLEKKKKILLKNNS